MTLRRLEATGSRSSACGLRGLFTKRSMMVEADAENGVEFDGEPISRALIQQFKARTVLLANQASVR